MSFISYDSYIIRGEQRFLILRATVLYLGIKISMKKILSKKVRGFGFGYTHSDFCFLVLVKNIGMSQGYMDQVSLSCWTSA